MVCRTSTWRKRRGAAHARECMGVASRRNVTRAQVAIARLRQGTNSRPLAWMVVTAGAISPVRRLSSPR